MLECYNCGTEYPPVATRWRCPACGTKDTCCDGEPQRPIKRRTTVERPTLKRRQDFWENE